MHEVGSVQGGAPPQEEAGVGYTQPPIEQLLKTHRLRPTANGGWVLEAPAKPKTPTGEGTMGKAL